MSRTWKDRMKEMIPEQVDALEKLKQLRDGIHAVIEDLDELFPGLKRYKGRSPISCAYKGVFELNDAIIEYARLLDKEAGLPLPKAYQRATELEYLSHFYQNSDFGPADEDVRSRIDQRFREKTGKIPPMGYDCCHYCGMDRTTECKCEE